MEKTDKKNFAGFSQDRLETKKPGVSRSKKKKKKKKRVIVLSFATLEQFVTCFVDAQAG